MPDEPVYWDYTPVDRQRTLLTKLSTQLEGVALDEVIDAARLLMMNALSQRYPDPANALEAFDQLTGKARARLQEVLDKR